MGLAADLAASEKRVQRSTPGVPAIKVQLDNVMAALEQAQSAAAAANERAEHAEEAQRRAESQLDTERTARTRAEQQAADEQRRRIEAEGRAERAESRADSMQAQVSITPPAPVAAPNIEIAMPEPASYDFTIERGGDGLIKTIRARPV